MMPVIVEICYQKGNMMAAGQDDAGAEESDRSRGRSTRWVVPGAIAVGVLLAVSLVFASLVQNWLNTSAHQATGRHMGLIGLILGAYSDRVGGLPYAVVKADTPRRSMGAHPTAGSGQILYSWRVEIVPDLDSQTCSWDPTRAWDDPSNKELKQISSVYAYETTGWKAASGSFPETNILAITGPGTAFGDGMEPPKALKNIAPQTILAVETRASGIPWPAPGDFDIRTMPQTISAPDGKGISSRYPGGFHVLFADGAVWLLSDKVPFDTLESFFTIERARKQDRDKLLGPFALCVEASSDGAVTGTREP